MGFRKEVRSFLREVREWMKLVSVGSQVYKDTIASQQKMIEELHCKLMARTYPEFKNFEMPTISEGEMKEAEKDLFQDEDIIGSIVQTTDESRQPE